MQIKTIFQKKIWKYFVALTFATLAGCAQRDSTNVMPIEFSGPEMVVRQSQSTPTEARMGQALSEKIQIAPTVHQVHPTGTPLPSFTTEPAIVPSIVIPMYEFDRGPIDAPRRRPTPVPIMEDPCDPIPENVLGTYGGNEILDNKAMVICDRQVLYDVNLPVQSRAIWDYTLRTGRLAYQGFSLMEDESSGLWVYDYWSKTSRKWLEGKVLDAAWAPTFDRNGNQLLAAVVERNPNVGAERAEGVLIIIADSEEFTPIKGADCCLAWSPAGDRIAYLKNGSLFVIAIDGGQPRKLAESVSSRPVWAIEQNAIIYAKENIHIAIIDGSENFIPKMPNGDPLYVEKATSFLWSPGHRRLLVGDALAHNCPCSPNAYWVFELSEDLRRVTHYYYREDSGMPDLLQWWVPGESALSSLGFKIDFLPSGMVQILRGTASGIKLNKNTFTLFLGLGFIPDGKKTVTVTSATQIFDQQGNSMRIKELEDRMSLEVTGQMVFEGYGIIAEKIQVLDG